MKVINFLEFSIEIWKNYGDKRTSQWILTKDLYLVLSLLAVFFIMSHVSEN